MTGNDTVTDSYRGMRWFKCDLHVHTPEDSAHWLDDDMHLASPRRPRTEGDPDEEDIQHKARKYLERCYGLGLEVIGVSDHNFSDCSEPRDRFLTHVIQQNNTVAEKMDTKPIWIFPGFEVDIGYHVVCLFPPTQRKVNRIDATDAALSALGLPQGGRFDGANPQPLRGEDAYVPLRQLLKIVQEEHGGIVIAAHAFSDKTLAMFATHGVDLDTADDRKITPLQSALIEGATSNMRLFHLLLQKSSLKNVSETLVLYASSPQPDQSTLARLQAWQAELKQRVVFAQNFGNLAIR